MDASNNSNPNEPGTYTCLVVEDSDVMRQLVVFALARVPGLSIVEAQNGLEAMKKLAEQQFDLVLTDINMPIMDGLKLIKRLRSEDAHKDVPVVVITTEGAEVDRNRAMELGATAYLIKPVQAQQVIEIAKRLLAIS